MARKCNTYDRWLQNPNFDITSTNQTDQDR